MEFYAYDTMEYWNKKSLSPPRCVSLHFGPEPGGDKILDAYINNWLEQDGDCPPDNEETHGSKPMHKFYLVFFS